MQTTRTIKRDDNSTPWRTAGLPAVVLAIAIAYLSAGVAGVLEPAQSIVLTSVQAALVAGQSLALLLRRTAPARVFAVVVLLHCGLLATSGAELGIGSLAVTIAVFHLVMLAERPLAFRVLGLMALVSSAVAFLTAASSGTLPLLAVLALVVARLVVEYLAPAGVAEFVRNRAQLADAARDREELVERERAYLLKQDRRDERTALARELHDIAGHHLSGIIVSAQAAGALIDKDPERSRSMLRELEQEARATMVDLRGTVGLLRPDTNPDTEDDVGRATVGIPGIGDLPGLADAAVRRGQRVSSSMTGEPFQLGPMAEAAMYRMVQESLANAARHAPDAASAVTVAYGADEVMIAVENTPSLSPPGPRPADGTPTHERGYGLIGMAERAELIGADLITGPTVSGGWRNQLRIPRLAHGLRR